LVRFVVPDVLDATQCGLLANEIGYRDFDDPILEEVVRIVSGFVETDFADPSYMRVECRKEGHDWHLDNGKHMPWCGVSASILLTERPDDGVGGVLEFADFVPKQKVGELWGWNQEEQNKHRVSRHDGWRVCLLMFLQGHA